MGRNVALEDMTLGELEAEIQRRKMAQDKPTPLANIDWAPLIRMASEHLDAVAQGEEDDDADHAFFEAVIDAVYGKAAWEYMKRFW